MHFSVAVAGLVTLASTALAGTAVVKNNCAEDVYLTITRGDQSTTQTKLAGNGGVYSEPISGSGNSFGLTKNSDYYSSSTPKLIWGFSDAAPTLYYSVSNVNGGPFDGESWNLTPSDGTCAVVTAYDGVTHTCADSNTFTLSTC